MTTPKQQHLITANESYAASFTQGHLPLPPSKKLAIVTCMDARIDPAAAYGIDLGSTHVIRNAGGSAREAFRSLVISQQLLGTEEVFVIKHTGCGMLTFADEDAKKIVDKNLGSEATAEVSGVQFGAFADLEKAVREDVAFLRASKAVRGKVSGWVYEVESGKVKRID